MNEPDISSHPDVVAMDMAHAAGHLHETYRALMLGGFNEDQSLTIIGRIIGALMTSDD